MGSPELQGSPSRHSTALLCYSSEVMVDPSKGAIVISTHPTEEITAKAARMATFQTLLPDEMRKALCIMGRHPSTQGKR